MDIQIGLPSELTNTRYAPLAVLLARYQRNHRLAPLDLVPIPVKRRHFSPADKLRQVFLSILAGCKTLSEVNSKLKQEVMLAAAGGWDHFADQSTLSRTLDALTLMNIEQLRQSVTATWLPYSQVRRHDWRGFLWLDFDLSGLPCSPRAEESQKGYFGGEKTLLDVNWPASVSSGIGRQSGRTCSPATDIRSPASARRC